MPERPAASAPKPTDPRPPAGWVRLARLGRTFQVRGALRADPNGPSAVVALRRLAAANGPIWVDGLGPSRLREARLVGSGLILAVQGFYDPERARALTHAHVWADPVFLPEPEPDGEGDEEDAVDVARLEGAAVTLDGAPYGRVAYVLLGAQDLLAIEGPDGEKLVPWAAPYVAWDGATVDLIDPPAGLLDDRP